MLFGIGTIGVLMSRNMIVLFMSIELMLNAANLALIAFSRALNMMDGHVMVFLVLTVAAAEAAVGLAMIITIYPQPGNDQYRPLQHDEMVGLGMMADYLFLIPLLPLIGFLINGLLIGRLPKPVISLVGVRIGRAVVYAVAVRLLRAEGHCRRSAARDRTGALHLDSVRVSSMSISPSCSTRCRR